MSTPRLRIHLSEPIDPAAMSLMAEHADLDVAEPFTPLSELYERVRDVDVIINNTDTTLLNRAMIDAAPRLRHIARHGSGYDNVDVPYATERGILVTNAAGGNAVTMAEMTLCLMLCAARRVLPSIDAARRGHPDRTQFRGMELRGKTLGLIGVGHIGREVARLAQAMGMTTIGYHYRPMAEMLAAYGICQVDLDTLLRTSHVVSLHTPLNKQTLHLIAQRELQLMQPGSILLNMARGGVVHEGDLIAAVTSGHLAAAALDVVEAEPIEADNPLLHVENILVVPHIGGQTPEAYSNNSMIVARDVLSYARGETPDRVINPDVLKKP